MVKQADSQQDAGFSGQVREKAETLIHETKERTREAAGRAGGQVRTLVDRQKEQAAGHLGSLAGALRATGRSLEEEATGGLGVYADRAAEQVERLSSYLRDNDLQALVRDTQSFARKRPEMFLGGALLAGLALARFLKASKPSGYDGADSGTGGNWTGYPQEARRSSYVPQRRNPDESGTASPSYNAPLGV